MQPPCQNRSKHRLEIQNVETFNFTNTWVFKQAEIFTVVHH